MQRWVLPLTLTLSLILPPAAMTAPAKQRKPPPPTQKAKPPAASKSVTVKRQPSPWMQEAQRQNQSKAQQRQKTIKDLQGAVNKMDRDLHKNRAKTAIKINKGVQQTLIGGH